MGNITPHYQRAKELCDQFPKHGNQTLARILKDEFNGIISMDTARCAVRYYRGAKGKKNRNDSGHEKPTVQERTATLPLPEPFSEWGANPWGPYQLKARRTLVLSDVHVPYFDKDAFALAIEAGKDAGVDCVFLNGDFLDFYSISRWLRDPRRRDFKGEVTLAREMLHWLRDTFKGCQIVWKLGNHEERWEHFMYLKAPEIVGIEEFEIEHWTHADKYNVRVIRDMRPVKINRLNLLHGHEYKFNISNPVNPARGLYLRAKVPAMMAHLHQTSEHTETNLNGTICTCWSVGCLCDLHPAYSPLNKWNHGFMIVDTTGEDDFTVQNKRIWRGRIL